MPIVRHTDEYGVARGVCFNPTIALQPGSGLSAVTACIQHNAIEASMCVQRPKR